jgi:hypothetical protein
MILKRCVGLHTSVSRMYQKLSMVGTRLCNSLQKGTSVEHIALIVLHYLFLSFDTDISVGLDWRILQRV